MVFPIFSEIIKSIFAGYLNSFMPKIFFLRIMELIKKKFNKFIKVQFSVDILDNRIMSQKTTDAKHIYIGHIGE